MRRLAGFVRVASPFRVVAAVATLASLTTLASGQSTFMVSVDTPGNNEGNGKSLLPSLSADGRYVVFESNANNLAGGDTNGATDILLRDRLANSTERVNVGTGSPGVQCDGDSFGPRISADGGHVVFLTYADNLWSTDFNFCPDVFVRDRANLYTDLVSQNPSGDPGDGPSYEAAISADGRFVAFTSFADDLVAGDANGWTDVFVRDRSTGVTERVSVDSAGGEANFNSTAPDLSADGRYVVFSSFADNLVANDVNANPDVFLHDRTTGLTTLVTVSSNGVQGDAGGDHPAISADGRFVAFASYSDNLVAGDTSMSGDIFVRDLVAGTTGRVSVDVTGATPNGDSFGCSISGDGRLVAWVSNASNLVAGDTNGVMDAFARDRLIGVTARMSVSSKGGQANGDSGLTLATALSADGRHVGFSSDATNLVPGDVNGVTDVYVRGGNLIFEATPSVVAAGADLTFLCGTALANSAWLIVVTDLNGTPLFLPIDLGSFDAYGDLVLLAKVPAGLAGNVVTLEVIGAAPGGKIESSNAQVLTFQ
jgi:Tol biopolymer transport system component